MDSGLKWMKKADWPGIDIHIASESLFTSLRNDYSHAPESAGECELEDSAQEPAKMRDDT